MESDGVSWGRRVWLGVGVSALEGVGDDRGWLPKNPWRARGGSRHTTGPWPHAKGENCAGKSKEGAAVEVVRDPSLSTASAASVSRDVSTVGDPYPKRWAVVLRLPASFAKSPNFLVEGSFDLTLDVKGDFVEGAPLEFVVTQ